MSKKKSNIFLSSAYNLYGLSSCKHCGFMKPDDLHKLLENLKNAEIPASSCIHELSTHFEQTDSIDKREKTTTERLIISVWPVAKTCKIDDYRQCTTYIKKGKCTDKFVIDHIGKKLFADKYQGR